MRFIEIPALITEDIEDPSIVDITEEISVSISGTTMTIDGGSKVSGEATVTLTGDTTVNAFTLQNIKHPSLHKISIKTGRKGNFTYVPTDTVTASSVSTTTKTGSDFEILLITTTGGETYVDFDMADYTSPALYTSNALTGFNVSELTSTYGATAKLYKPDGTLLTTVTSATTGGGVNFGYTESIPGDVTYTLEVTDDLGRKSKYDLPRKWINYAMGTTSTPGFQKFRLEGIDDDYTTTVMFPSLGSSSTAKVYRTSDHGYLGINFKIQGRNSTGDDWVDIANADENDDVLAFGDFLYHRVWVKPTAKATTTVSSSNVVTLTLSNLTEENVTTSFDNFDPYDINESTNTYVFEETTKIGTVPFTVTLGGETYTNSVTATTEGTAYDYVTLAFANPTLSLTTSNVTISSAKLYKDDVLFHTYGTESNVVLRSDQTGTYQAIVNDVYYSNRVTPDFTTTRSVSAPQLEFDGYNKLTFFKETLIQNNVIVTDTRTGGAWGCHLNIDANYTGEGYQWKLHKDDSSHSLVPDHDFDDDSGHGIYRYLRYTGTEDLGSWTFYNVNTDDSQGSQDTVLKIYSSNGSNEVTNAGIGSTLWVWSWNMSFSGHLTKSIFTPTSTTLGLPDGTTRDLTTQSNVYIYEPGTYTANVQTSETFAYLSNVATIQTVTQPTLVNTIPITAGDFSGYNYQHEATDTTNTYYEYNMSLNSTGSTYFIAYNWTTKKWFDTNPTDANNTFGISATDTAATSRETTENPKVVYVIGTNNGQIVLESQFINPYFTGPSLTFDGFNKLTIENLTQTSSTLKYGSNTYDTNTASNVYVTDAGEYKLEARDANTFVMSNVYVGAVSQHPSDVVPTLTFDGYNKLTIDNVDTVETATIKKDGAAFATTTSNTVYIRDTGTYTAEVKGSGEYAIELSKEVGTINNAPDWRETQFQLLYSENPNQNDRFGSVVDIDGDYACIGSGYDDTNAVDKGAVYVFHKSNGVWTYQDILQPDSTSEDFAVLNSSLSIHGDTIAAGAQANDTGGNDFGAVYVFRRNGTSWSKEAKLQTNDVQTSDNFGSGVGIYGDYIVGGAYAEDTGGSRAGSAYIFKRTGTIWEQTAKIQSGDQSEDDKFGLNCKIYGDYVIVGAPEEDIGGSEYGAAYIFKRDALSRPTTNVIVLSPADWGSPAQHFHRNPSLDTTTSSFYELVQGTSWGTGTTTDTGHGIELRLNGTNTELYVNSDNNNLDPITVSIGDGTASSSVTLISGQTCTLYKADGTGYSFTVNSGHLFGEVWSKTETLLASDGASGDFFGQSVDIYDGYAIVGASIKDYNDGTNTGGAYIFKKNVDESWTEQAILISDDPIDNYQFGASVYIKGNYAIVGEPGSTNTGGFMYVFERSGSTWTQIKKFQVTNGQDANFGTSVAISGDTILSGALYDDVKDVNTGVCYVFSKTPPGSYVTFDNYNKITLENTNYEDTATVSDPNGSIHEIGTAKTMYVKDAGEYVFKISGTDKYVESNVYVSSVDLAGATTKPIDFDGYNKLTLIDAGSNVSANVTYFSNTYELGSANVLYINGAGTYDLEMSGSNVFALSSNVVGTVSQHPTDVVPSLTFDNYNKLTLENFTTTESDTRTAKLTDPNDVDYSLGQTQNDIYIEDTGEYILEVTNSDQSAVVKTTVGTVSQHPTDVVPSLTYDNYNKLTIENITPTSTTLRFGSNTYDIGTASNVYIEDAGTYKFATGDATTFVLVSNVVSGSVGSRTTLSETSIVKQFIYDTGGYTDAMFSEGSETQCIRLSSDGLAMALGDGNYNSNDGRLYYYERSSISDTFTKTHTFDAVSSGLEFGASVDMNAAKTRIAISGSDADSSAANAGRVYIYDRASTSASWPSSPTATITPPASTIKRFGYTVNMSDDGLTMITSGDGNSSTANESGVYVYEYAVTAPSASTISFTSGVFTNNSSYYEKGPTTATTVLYARRTPNGLAEGYGLLLEYQSDGTTKAYCNSPSTENLTPDQLSIDGGPFSDSVILISGKVLEGQYYSGVTAFKFTVDSTHLFSQWSKTFQVTQGITRFGFKVAMNKTGTRFIAGGTGTAYYVYHKESGTWSSTAALTGATGYHCGMSPDGNTVAVGIVQYSSNLGRVAVYKYSGGSWGSATNIDTTVGSGIYSFGNTPVFNNDGTLLVTGCSGYNSYMGCFEMWKYENGSWVFKNQFLNPTVKTGHGGGDTGEFFGAYLSMDYTGTSLIVSNPGNDVAGDDYGRVVLYGVGSPPSLTYDTSNKLSIANLTPTSTTLTDPNGSSFDIGTATDVYIRDSGTYSIASKDANTFALASNTVTGTPTGTYDKRVPLAFHHGTFADSDDPYGDGSVTVAATNGHVYSDTPTGVYTWGTLGSASNTTTNSTYTWTPPNDISGADVLMVAGGGSGGYDRGGGGGAGGLLYHTNQTISGQKTIVVGNGGLSSSSYDVDAVNNGNNTLFTGLDDAIGGGGGSIPHPTPNPNVGSGGSGGGGGDATYSTPGTGIAGQGYSGGTSNGNAAGGGGAGGAGGDSVSGTNPSNSGNGGAGLNYSNHPFPNLRYDKNDNGKERTFNVNRRRR
jgi:hypothetical protein